MVKTTSGLSPISISDIASAYDVLTTLQLLTDKLESSELSQLVPFNKAYVVVTETMHTAIIDGAFQNPDIINSFIVAFGRYYFQVINDHIKHKPVTPAWDLLCNPSYAKRPAFIALLMGANAHINYDLPLALNDVLKGKSPGDLYKDLRIVDRLIMRGSRKVLDTFNEPYPQAAYIKQHGSMVYYYPVMYSILYWRFNAWRNYTKLYKKRLTKENIMMRSLRIAQQLNWLGSKIDNS